MYVYIVACVPRQGVDRCPFPQTHLPDRPLLPPSTLVRVVCIVFCFFSSSTGLALYAIPE